MSDGILPEPGVCRKCSFFREAIRCCLMQRPGKGCGRPTICAGSAANDVLPVDTAPAVGTVCVVVRNPLTKQAALAWNGEVPVLQDGKTVTEGMMPAVLLLILVNPGAGRHAQQRDAAAVRHGIRTA